MDPAAPTLPPNPKQQIVERLKGVTNILVTVSANPSVDQLAATIALTLMLNNMNKHATALFSGKIPEAIKFLEPEKTIENNLDLLRDFIISLDRNKASKLRYKDEGEIVRIFITPYHTKIDEHDLQFSQGEVNVEVVVALGVEQRNDLDAAVAAHGRILHDATIISINTGAVPGNLGSLNWNEPAASSLCEMLMSMSEALQTGLVDTQVATALLTGIVAETQRFSNPKTTPKVMTMSAQLMAAGANQQLIANSLQGVKPLDNQPAEIPHDTPITPTQTPPANEMDVMHAPTAAQSPQSTPAPQTPVAIPMPSPTSTPPASAQPPVSSPAIDSWTSQAKAEASEDAPLPPPATPQQSYAPPAPQPAPQGIPTQPVAPRFQSMPTPVVAPDITQTFPSVPAGASPQFQTKTINPASLSIQPPSVHGVQSGLQPRHYMSEEAAPQSSDSPVSPFSQTVSEAQADDNKILSHNQRHIESLSEDAETAEPGDPNVAIARAREAVQHAIEEPTDSSSSISTAPAPSPTPAPKEEGIVPEPHAYEETPLPAPATPSPTPMPMPEMQQEQEPVNDVDANTTAAPPNATFKIPTPMSPPPDVKKENEVPSPTLAPPPDAPPPIPL